MQEIPEQQAPGETRLKRLIIPAAAVIALLVTASAADASGLSLGGRNPKHGSSKNSTRVVAKLKGTALSVRNLGGGPAFTFMTTGLLGGTITVGKGGDNAAPFTTNATGVAKGLNADRLDGHDASDFMLAKGGLIDATTLSGHSAADFLPVGGKAANANLLDGLDSTAFLAANATAVNSNQLGGHAPSFFLPATGKAADSDKLDGQDSTEFVASSTRLSLGGSPFMAAGDPTKTFATVDGMTLKATCDSSSAIVSVHLKLANSSGTAHFVTSADAPGGGTNASVTSTDGDAELITGDSGGNLTDGKLFPFQAVLAKEDGTVFQGVITLGVNFAGHDCFVSGSLSS